MHRPVKMTKDSAVISQLRCDSEWFLKGWPGSSFRRQHEQVTDLFIFILCKCLECLTCFLTDYIIGVSCEISAAFSFCPQPVCHPRFAGVNLLWVVGGKGE